MCAASASKPQPVRASPSQPGPRPASRRSDRAATTRQGPARHKKETRSGRVTSNDWQVTCGVACIWASSSFCATLFSRPPKPPERARTLTVHGQSDNRAKRGEPLKNRTGFAHASSANFHSAGFNAKQAPAFGVQTALLSPLSATRRSMSFESTHPDSPR